MAPVMPASRLHSGRPGDLCRSETVTMGCPSLSTTPHDHVFGGVHDGYAGLLGFVPRVLCGGPGSDGTDDYVAFEELERAHEPLRRTRHHSGKQMTHASKDGQTRK